MQLNPKLGQYDKNLYELAWLNTEIVLFHANTKIGMQVEILILLSLSS